MLEIPNTQGPGGGASFSEAGREKLKILVARAAETCPAAVNDGFAQRLASGRMRPTDRRLVEELGKAGVKLAAETGDRSWAEAGRALNKMLNVKMTK